MIPLKTSELLDKIIQEHGLSIEAIAKQMNVSRRSIYRVLNGEKPSGKLVVGLIRLYLQLVSDNPITTNTSSARN